MDDSYENGAHRIDGVEDGAQIVHPLLDRWQRAAMDAVRKPHTAAVEQD